MTRGTTVILGLLCWGALLSGSKVRAQDGFLSIVDRTTSSRARTTETREPEDAEARKAAAKDEPELDVTLGGAIRFNLFYKSWDRPETIRSGGDDVAFDTFRLDVESTYGDLRLSAEYRFYAGYHMLHHAFLGYIPYDWLDVRVGVMRVPFGILPYASHNFFFSPHYYVGLEDDYDIGARIDFRFGALGVQLAFFRNDEGSYSGSSVDSARFSYDVVRTGPDELGVADGRRNEEKNQGNVRVTYTGKHSVGSTEVGLSGQFGGVENSDTDEFGFHWAGAVHVHGQYGPLDVQLQASRYGYELENPAVQDESFVVMGAYDAPYKVASDAYLFNVNVAYRFDVQWWLFETITVYNDYSYMAKIQQRQDNTQQNTTGALLHTGPIYAYFDVLVGRNHPWIGPGYETALAQGNPGADWHVRVNANVGYYF